VQVHAFDVTGLVVDGANAIGALLSDGWWRGQHGVIREIDAYGSTTAFLAELHIELASGDPVFAALRSWRKLEAEEQGVPAYVVADDRTLAAIAARRPRSVSELREVPGIGASRADRYGAAMLRIVADAA
jgi:ATP-dependent DNA helicase RecQ